MNTLATVNVTGPDAFAFLQGQLTNDIHRLDAEAEILAAWCSPKGRVIWFGTVRAIESGFALSAPAETAADLVKRLAVFRFRSKVDFSVVDEDITVDPEFLVQNGYAYIGAAQAEQFTPHMLNLDLIDAINFDKGCYTGQEIVARTHYKGATKRRTLRFESEQPVSVGDKVSDGDRDIGEVLNVSGNDLLAVVPVDKADTPLSVNGVGLTRQPLPYL
ncbi:MAG: folate-binding protein YgfZ [Gammaproteobacteria bacterium]|nr:folate-binding protein YgfZ [Gammaproteobacteria bacterium]